jgi:hypothetical protein
MRPAQTGQGIISEGKLDDCEAVWWWRMAYQMTVL